MSPTMRVAPSDTPTGSTALAGDAAVGDVVGDAVGDVVGDVVGEYVNWVQFETPGGGNRNLTDERQLPWKSKADGSMLTGLSDLGMCTVVKLGQPPNAPSPTAVTPLGMKSVRSAEHPKQKSTGIVSRLAGSVTLVKLVQN